MSKIIIYISGKLVNVTVIDKSIIVNHISKKLSKSLDFIQQYKEIVKNIPDEYSRIPVELVISSENIILRYLKLPADKSNSAEIIYWELVKLYSAKFEQYYWNFKKIESVVEDSVKKQNFKIELVSKNFVDGIVKILSERKFKIRFIVSEESVFENLISVYQPDAVLDNHFFLINMDSDNIVLTFFENGYIKYKRSFENIAEQMTKIIAEYFKKEDGNISERIKDIHLLPYSEPEGFDIEKNSYIEFSNNIKIELKLIADEIKKTENFLKSNYKISQVNQIFATGFLSKINGLPQLFKSELNKSIQIYSVPENNQIKDKSGLIYSMNNMNEKNAIKLNEKINRSAIEFSEDAGLIKKPVFQLVMIMIILTMITLPSYIENTHKKLYDSKIYLNNQLQSQISELDKFLSSQNIVTVNKKIKIFIESNNYDYNNLFKLISRSAPQGVMFTKFNFKTLKVEPKPQSVIVIQGWSVSPMLVPSFIVNLDKTNLFMNINLDNSSREVYKSYNMTRFEITAVLKEATLL
ncbi:PilN domain-containing protein [Candidatus Dependentiae bacterium]|nr:PilN domain-containing protein [Candidatus Dependentiae bacterium]